MGSIRRKVINETIELAIEALLLDKGTASSLALASDASALLRGLVTNCGREPFYAVIDPCIRPNTAEFELLGAVRDYATIYKFASPSTHFCHATFPMRLFMAYLLRLYPNAKFEPFREHIAPGSCLPDLEDPDPKTAAANSLRQYFDDRLKNPPIPPAK